MEKRKAMIREWCLDKAGDILRLTGGLENIAYSDGKTQIVKTADIAKVFIEVAREVEKYIDEE